MFVNHSLVFHNVEVISSLIICICIYLFYQSNTCTALKNQMAQSLTNINVIPFHLTYFLETHSIFLAVYFDIIIVFLSNVHLGHFC